jgi:hypothetical protein
VLPKGLQSVQRWIEDDSETLCDDCVERIVGGGAMMREGGRCEVYTIGRSARQALARPDTGHTLQPPRPSDPLLFCLNRPQQTKRTERKSICTSWTVVVQFRVRPRAASGQGHCLGQSYVAGLEFGVLVCLLNTRGALTFFSWSLLK